MADAGDGLDIGEVVADILRASYHYASADGHVVVGTDLVLTAAARNDETAASVLGAAVVRARSSLKRAAGPAQAPADGVDDGSSRYAGALREARWWVLRDSDDGTGDAARGGAGKAADDLGVAAGGPGWSAGVCAALDRAGREAAAAGAARVGVEHLLLGLLDVDDPAVRSLAQATDLDVAATVRRLRAGRLDVRPQPAMSPLAQMLESFGAIDKPGGWPLRWIPRLVAKVAGRDGRLGGPVLACLQDEVLRQAVIMGDRRVQTSAVLLAVLSLDEQLAASGQRLKPEYAAHNRGGVILSGLGCDLRRAQRVAQGVTEPGTPLSDEEAAARFWGGRKAGDPAWDGNVARVLNRAGEFARERGHSDIGTSHLLAALLAEPESAAAQQVVAGLGVDPQRVRELVARDLAVT